VLVANSLFSDINTVSGTEGPGVSNAECNSVSRPKGLTLSVQLTVTDSTIRGKFYCRGFEGGSVEEIISSTISFKVKGKLLKVTVPILKVLCVTWTVITYLYSTTFYRDTLEYYSFTRFL